jgi:nucleoid-associated protein YgaU
VKALLLLCIAFGAAACGDASSSRLVSADVADRADGGCVAREPRAGKAPRTWLVRDGDSLRRIARKVYGDEKLWKAIRAANVGKIARDGSVAPGTSLTIPFDGV